MMNLQQLAQHVVVEDDNCYNSVQEVYDIISPIKPDSIRGILRYLMNSKLVLWRNFLQDDLIDSLLENIDLNVNYLNSTPTLKNIFKAYYAVDPMKVRVMIIGMDPYPQMINGERYATGIPFQTEGYMTKSLKTFLDELYDNVSVTQSQVEQSTSESVSESVDRSGYVGLERQFSFEKVIAQGVFITNCANTVTIDSPGSHSSLWTDYTAALVRYLVKHNPSLVICAIGAIAQNCVNDVLGWNSPVTYLKVAHPAAGDDCQTPFRGSGIFNSISSKVNPAIEWL